MRSATKIKEKVKLYRRPFQSKKEKRVGLKSTSQRDKTPKMKKASRKRGVTAFPKGQKGNGARVLNDPRKPEKSYNFADQRRKSKE